MTIDEPPTGPMPEPAQYLVELGQHVLATTAATGGSMPALMRLDRGQDASLMLSLPPDHIYEAIEAMPTAFGADVMVIAFDSFRSTLENDPRTDEPWTAGAMSEVAENGGIALGLVAECMNIAYVERTPHGDVLTRLWSLGYERQQDGLHWTTGIDADDVSSDDPDDDPDMFALSGAGRMPAAMIAAMRIVTEWEPDADRATLDMFSAHLAQRKFEADVWMQRPEESS